MRMVRGCNWFGRILSALCGVFLSLCLLQLWRLTTSYRDLPPPSLSHTKTCQLGAYTRCERSLIMMVAIILLADVCTTEEEIFSFSHGRFLHVLKRGMYRACAN